MSRADGWRGHQRCTHRAGVTVVSILVCGAAILVNVPVGGAAARNAGSMTTMIVMLRPYESALAPSAAARAAAITSEQAPIIRSLHESGATDISALSAMNALVAKMSMAEARLLAGEPSVEHVLANTVIPGPVTNSSPPPAVVGAKINHDPTSKVTDSSTCGTAKDPQLNPEALTNINATPAQLGSNDGAGVTVAVLADGLDTNDPDLQRNAAYGTPGQPVVQQIDFSGDGTNAPTQGNEAFGDASSIAAQGNVVYDLSQYVSPAHPLPSNCDIKIVGVAPGATVENLKVFGTDDDTTESGFLEAINYAVTSGAKVINESFASTSFPDTALDVTRDANDAAVAAGVTVVVSAGDAGNTSTIGSPATDPDVISVGASTTFRAYTQLTYGGINDPNASGAYVDDNISSLSSGGYTQAGNTVDLVAPGDLNWALCGASRIYADCYNENVVGSPIQLFGGTSESAPLTAAAAADVISAYASTHDGQDPTPTLVKEILMSTASDIDAPATEQGAGLLNVLAAVKEARSIDDPTSKNAGGGLLLNPGQVNVIQNPGDTSSRSVQVTNTGPDPVTVDLSTWTLSTSPIGYQTGDFCMEPGAPKPACPGNTGSFPIWNGAEDTYQDEHFTVPPTNGLSRLDFAADHTYTGQGALLNFALLEPNGAYAAYSLPQGLGDYGEVEVANPPPGRWTAVFFTQNSIGTSGVIRWSAETLTYAAGATVEPSSLTLAPGKTGVAQLSITSTDVSGDSSQSLVVSSPYGTTTVPVTVRTTLALSDHGGVFSGVLTGGNGRGAQAATSTFAFNVPYGERDLDVSVALADDPQDAFIAELIDPNGQTVSYSTNAARDNQFGDATASLSADLYALDPVSGAWSLLVEWLNPVSGLQLNEPFSGTIQFNQVDVTSDLPDGTASLVSGAMQTYEVHVANTGNAPEEFFLDPRLDQTETINLVDQNFPPTAQNMTLPLAAGLYFPYYTVPSQTTQLQASITGSAPVTFDLQYSQGDPDISPGVNDGLNATGSVHGDSADMTLSEPEVSAGTWLLNPDEIGPYPSTGAPTVTASANLRAVTQTFDKSMTSTTGDMWSALNGLSSGFDPVYVAPGTSATITVRVAPTDAPGTRVTGTLYVDDYVLGSTFFDGPVNSDELAAIPYSYVVSH
ncbi:MAG: S8 family serine peptidase [Acidimicrobiales bacterium]